MIPAAAFKGEVRRWAAKIGVRPRRVELRHMTSKWASCSAAGRICFSRDLLAATSDFRAWVIVHELLHLRVPNHGRLFRRLLAAYVPMSESRLKSPPCQALGSVPPRLRNLPFPSSTTR